MEFILKLLKVHGAYSLIPYIASLVPTFNFPPNCETCCVEPRALCHEKKWGHSNTRYVGIAMTHNL